MKHPLFKALAALLIAALALSGTALMETEPEATEWIAEIEAETPADAIDETVPEADVELSEAAADRALEAEALPDPESAEEDLYDLEPEGDGPIEEDPAAPVLQAWPEGSLIDRDALFSGYVDHLFGLDGGAYEARNLGGDLTGERRALYDYLRACIGKVAAGQLASTEFTYSKRGSLSGADVDDVLARLIADCPYELYWLGSAYSVYAEGNRLYISLAVGSDYAAGEYAVNTSLASRAAAAAANARAIVAKYASRSDYDKLVAYRDAICDAVRYNNDAVSSTWPQDRMSPWQLIWVFDGDPGTNVVCEGYAKAFQYLCDMSSFSGRVICYSVTGYGNGGLHKWNIVRMPNGRNYLVDVTFCDQEGSGTYDWLFMKAPLGGSVSQGYRFNIRNDVGYFPATYIYDDTALSIYTTADLTLSAGGYLEEAGLAAPDTGASTAVDLPVSTPDPVPATPTIAATKSRKVTVTAAPGSVYQLDLGGKTGKKFKSSNKKVAAVTSAGLVTVKKAGKAKITFKVGKKKRTITLKIVDPTVPKQVTLNLSGTVAVKKGDAVTLTAALPEGTNSPIKWKSSNKKVATVSSAGVVTFRKKGKVTITATATRGKKKAKVKFKVGK